MAIFVMVDRVSNGTLGAVVGGGNKDLTCRFGFAPHTLDSIFVYKQGQLLTPNSSIGAADHDYEPGQFAEIGKIKLTNDVEADVEYTVVYYPIGGTI